MKQYYYLNGIDRIGPLTKEQLLSEPIKADTLIWYEGMTQWKPFVQIPEFKARNEPPPVPTDILDFEKNHNQSSLIPSRRQVGLYLLWAVVLVVLFLLTKTDNDFLQSSLADTSKLWPFTAEFYAEKINHPSLTYGCQTMSGDPCFYGFLADYDISEVIIYSLIPIVFFLLKGLLTKNK